MTLESDGTGGWRFIGFLDAFDAVYYLKRGYDVDIHGRGDSNKAQDGAVASLADMDVQIMLLICLSAPEADLDLVFPSVILP